MASVREMLDLVKCKIKFSTYEGDYEGVVQIVYPVAEKVTVENIFYLPGRIWMGALNFSCSEIEDIVVLNRPGAVDVQETKLPSIRCYGDRKDYDRILVDDFDDSDELSVDTDCERDYPEEQYVLKLPPGFQSIPADVYTFDRIGEEFRLVMEHVKSQNVIGVSLEGPKLGRHGIVSWLGLATSQFTFLFDIQELGDKLFDEGLREIMEDGKIQKVIHDCREVSDCLFHMFSTRLVNVFDTQVADKLVTMQRSRDCKLNKHVNPLNSCLRTYLEVPEDFLYRSNLSQSHQVNVAEFRQRPPKNNLKDVMVKNVIYLRFLKEKLEQELLNPFRRAVEVYLGVLQGATNQELLLEPSVPGELPPELVMQGIQIVKFKTHVDVPLDIASGTSSERVQNPVKQLLKLCESRKNVPDSCKESQFLSDSSTYLKREEPKMNVSAGKGNEPSKDNTKLQHFCQDGNTPHRSVAVKSDGCVKKSVSYSTKDVQNNVPHHSTKDVQHSISDFSSKNVQNGVSDYSRSQLDKMFLSVISESSFDKEENPVTQIEESENSCEEAHASDDPWVDLRAEFSKYSDTSNIDKRRFVPG